MVFAPAHILCLLLACAGSIAAALHILLNMRDEPERALLWLLLVFAFPVLGVILYLFFGLSRRNTFGSRVRNILSYIRGADSGTLKGLFAERSRTLRPFIAHRAGAVTDISATDAEAALDRLFPNTPPLAGNLVELFCDGDAAYPEMLRAIREAKESIHMQSFIFSNDRVGCMLFDAMSEKARQGVSVKVIYDSFGSFGAMRTQFFRRYAGMSPNMSVHPFSRATLLNPWRYQLRNHRKLLITDGRTAFLGGLNISAENFHIGRQRREIHDLHCRVSGPAVSELQMSFLQDWSITTREKPDKVFLPHYFPAPRACGSANVRVIASGHGYLFQGTEQVFHTAVSTAQKYIWICTPYFVPDKPFCKALRVAALRGVDVRIILPKNNNHFFMRLASRNLYEPLCTDGVRIFEKLGEFSHAKAMLCDGRWAYFGSSNCDVRSFRLNYELDIAVSDGPFIEALHHQFLAEIENAVEIRLEEIEKTPVSWRLLQSLCALFTPLL